MSDTISAPTTTPVESTTGTRETPGQSGQQTPATSLKGSLRGMSYDQQVQQLTPPGGPGEQPPVVAATGDFTTQLGIWMPAVVKVADPVAFMTSADDKGNRGKGNYAQAINNKAAKGGFFEVAKGELVRIQAEINAYVGAKADLEEAQKGELQKLAEMLGGYRELYSAIQDTGMSEDAAKDPGKRAKVAARVQAVVGATRGKVIGLNPEMLGLASLQRIAASFDEVALFVESWSSMSGDPQSGASPYMWGSFLQTVERYRSIMNEYGTLEERGGSATGTSKMAVKGGAKPGGYAKTKEEADAAAAAKGGNMALALESYSLRAESIAAMQKQVAAMQVRVKNGEFATQEEAVAAFRKEVGGGRASEAFYDQLEALAKSTWSASQGDKLVNEEKKKLDQAKTDYVGADKSVTQSGTAGKVAANDYEEHKKHSENMDLTKSDAAWAACQDHKARSEALLAQSKALLASGDSHRAEALELHGQAMAALASAKLALKSVDPKRWPQLSPGVQSVEGQISAAESKLATNAETAKQLQEYRATIANKVAAMDKASAAFDPKKIEVPAPTTSVLGMEGELSHYEGFDIELSGKVPGAPYLELFGGASGKGGTTLKGGKLWSFAEGEWTGGVKLDCWIFTISIAYIGGVKYEVLGDHSVRQVIVAGDAERAKWDAAREVGKKGYDVGIKAVFDSALKKGQDNYQILTGKAAKVSGGDKSARPDFDRSLETVGEQINSGQDALELGAAAVFYDISGIKDMIIALQAITDGSVLEADLMSLRGVPDKALLGATQASQQHFENDNRQSDGYFAGRFAEINKADNDPNVKFEASGSWEVGASAGIGGAKVKGAVRNTTTVKDGDGEKFDYKEEKSTTYSAEAEMGFSTVKVEVVSKDEELEVGVGGTLSCALPGKDAQEEIIAAGTSKGKLIWSAMKPGGDAGALGDALKEWYEGLSEKIGEKMAKPEMKLGAKHKVELNFTFTQKKDPASEDWYWAEGKFGIGFVTETGGEFDVGVVAGKAVYKTGMKATFKLFERDAPSKQASDAREAKKLADATKTMSAVGAGDPKGGKGT